MGKAITQAKMIAAEDNAAEQAAEVMPEEVPEIHAVTLDELEGMDMETLGNEAQPWRITDDEVADWAVQKIAVERAELARIKELADAQIARIMEKVQAAEKRCENGTAYLTSKLAEYFATVPQKKTKTQRTYRLLSGTLKMKIGGVSMKQNDEKLLEYLKATGNTDMIQTTEKPRWGELKKRLEIVEGVEVVQKPDVFTIDV